MMKEEERSDEQDRGSNPRAGQFELTPTLFTTAVARMLMRFNTRAAAVTIPASSTISPLVGACHSSGPNTVEMVIATEAVPVANANQHIHPVNHP